MRHPSIEATVVIPVYKVQPSANEILSLKQCIKLLGKYHLTFICATNLDIRKYEELCTGDIPFRKVVFDDAFFSDIAGYNRLMLSTTFYKTFLGSAFLLIYQLDAFVFKDELIYWCRQGYDYIGAPQAAHENQAGEMQFLKNFTRVYNFINRVFGTVFTVNNVGNGGFSLRNTRACYRLLKCLPKKTKAWGTLNEDGFFKYWGNIFFPFFRLPTVSTAQRFAVEKKPALALAEMNGNLPFGCHAFEKYDPGFWQQHIPI